MQLSARSEQPENKTHLTPSCLLQAIERWLYSQVAGVPQQGTMGRLSLHRKMCGGHWRLELVERFSLRLFLATSLLDYLMTDEDEIISRLILVTRNHVSISACTAAGQLAPKPGWSRLRCFISFRLDIAVFLVIVAPCILGLQLCSNSWNPWTTAVEASSPVSTFHFIT